MKKNYILIILITFLFSCAGTGNINRNVTADSPVSLDMAIALAAEHIASDLSPGTRIAIVDFESENDNLSHHIMEELTGELISHNIEIADRQNLPYIFQEFAFQMSGAVNDETAQSIGKIIGAELIVVGRLLDIVEMYRNQVDAVHVENATRESAARNNVRKDQATQRLISALANQQTTVKVYRYAVTEQTKPETAGVFLDRGIMFAMRGEYDKAIADFDEAIKLNPNLVGAYMLRGRALYASVSVIREVGENFSGFISMSYLYNFQIQNAPEKVQIYDLAIADYTQAIWLDPTNSFAYTSRGMVYSNKGDLDWAIADHTQAIRLHPHYAAAYSNRGLAYYEKGDFDRAITDFTEALNLNPINAVIYSNRANAYIRNGDMDKAIADCNTALMIKPDLLDALNNRGNAYAEKGDRENAIADYSAILRIRPEDYAILNNRGIVYIEKGDIDLAIMDFTESLRIIPDQYVALNLRGIAYYYKKDYDNAILDSEAVIRFNPNDPRIRQQARQNIEQARQERGY